VAWTYSDWITNDYGATRLERFRLHVQEVADKLTAEIGEGQTEHSTHALQRYLDKLQDREAEEVRRCDNATASNSQFIRGRPVRY
jgi:hypothetical protein